jgi:hypothetical protein
LNIIDDSASDEGTLNYWTLNLDLAIGPSCSTFEDCSFPNTVSSYCNDGICEIGRCQSGFSNCNSQVIDGCEQDVLGDVLHCGKCQQACETNETCNQGVCQLLPDDEETMTADDGGITTPDDDETNIADADDGGITTPDDDETNIADADDGGLANDADGSAPIDDDSTPPSDDESCGCQSTKPTTNSFLLLLLLVFGIYRRSKFNPELFGK